MMQQCRLGWHELCILAFTFWSNHKNHHQQLPNFSSYILHTYTYTMLQKSTCIPVSLTQNTVRHCKFYLLHLHEIILLITNIIIIIIIINYYHHCDLQEIDCSKSKTWSCKHIWILMISSELKNVLVWVADIATTW